MTISEALANTQSRLAGAGIDDAPRLEAQLLLAWSMARRREDLAREPERTLTAAEQASFEAAVNQRARRVPLPYITGTAPFYGREFHVTSAVLIPRPETEMLVRLTLDAIAGIDAPRVADIGVGSGCIAVSIAAERRDARLFAVDISPRAIAVAAGNAKSHGVDERVELIEGDLLRPVLAMRLPPFHAIVSNPPYVTEAELAALQPEVRDFEPKTALSGVDGESGPTGTALYPPLFEQSRQVLVDGGWVLVEIGQGQSETVMQAAIDAGFTQVESVPDFAGIPRVVLGRAPAREQHKG